MIPLASYYAEAAELALAGFTIVLVFISTKAYRTRPEPRYLLLMLAFVSLCIVALSTLSLEFFVGLGPGTVTIVEIYVIPSLELLMVISFLLALVWYRKEGRSAVIYTAAVLVALGLAGASAAYLSGSTSVSGTQSGLPQGCIRPTGGFLIVVTSTGYNDSIGHGAPIKSWPIIDVSKDTDVRITVCNAYSVAAGFQVAHYFANHIEAVAPGRVMSLSFVANETGSYVIYCAVFNPIHVYLQGGELNVS